MNSIKIKTFFTGVISTLALAAISSSSIASYYYTPQAKNYEVTVTNITKGETFTPILSAAHSKNISFFEVGEASSAELADLAESGNIAPLQAVLDGSDLVYDTSSSEGLLLPGESTTFTLTTTSVSSRLSFAAMLIPTNDTFVSLNNVQLPYYGSVTYFANAYDAGSETNDELCANMPGPACGGAGPSPDDLGEGYIFTAAGIHGEGDLKASIYDWRGSVAKVVVRRVYN